MNKYIVLILVPLICSMVSEGQEQFRAVHWGTSDGLSWAGGNHMLKGKNGFLWISSVGGLNRFDGNTFKKYPEEGPEAGNLASGYTAYELIEDSLHNIWIGTNEGISRYDINADTFTNFKIAPDSVLVAPNSLPFWATENELFVIHLNSKTIYAFNIHTLTKRTVIKLTDIDTIDVGNFRERSIVYDKKSNSLWMIAGFADKPGGGLLRVLLSTGKREHYVWPCALKIVNHSHRSESICLDQKRNCLWLNTKDGLVSFNLGDKQFHLIGAYNNWSHLKDYDFADGLGITIDLLNRVWVSTSPNGIFIYDPSNDSFSLPFHDAARQKEVASSSASIYCDKDGMIWLSEKGICQLVPFSPAVKRYEIYGEVQNFLPADHGNIWVGGWPGLYSLDPASGAFSLIRKKYDPAVHLDSNFPMMIDTIRKKAWIGVEPWGIYEMDMRTLKYQQLVFKNINNQVITAGRIAYNNIRPFENGFLFVVYGQGVFYVDKDSLVAQQVLATAVDIYQAIPADNKLLFLVCSKPLNKKTYSYQNNRWIPVSNPIDSLPWANIFYNDKDKSYWAGCNRELLHFNSAFKKLESYTAKNGLPYQAWANITSDASGNIWLCTPLGVIAQLNVKTAQITTLSDKDGYQKNSFGFFPPFFKDADGDLYFAGGEGIDRVSPAKVNSSPPSSVYFQSLEVNQQPFSFFQGIDTTQQLSLKYFQNKISIGTGIIDFYSKGKSQIRYKLEKEGNTAPWQYAPDYYTIRYDGLQPGNYRLVIQASNATNEFNGADKILFINISPAFWNTWWFRIIAAFFLVALIYGLMRWRLNQQFRLQLERSENERKLAELKQKASELEMQALRAQMNPHFIFNSLNSINRFILQNNQAQASEYLTKFSKLVRMILQNSQAVLITLESELESLQLYLELEAVRFDHHFEFKITVEDDLDVSAIKVPPLIIQPYAENAIWHGLMHKEEKGHLEIELFQQKDVLCCRIADDGIGRKKAAALKSKSASTHKSMGMQITASRIEMLQQKKQLNASIEITDPVLPDGSADGTEVMLKIPIMQ